MKLFASAKNFKARIFGLLERNRLANAIAQTKIDFNDQIRSANAVAKKRLKATVGQFLKEAERYLSDRNLQQGWDSLMCAQRAILSNSNDPERIRRAAITLRREADKITGWRAKAIQDLICGPNGELVAALKNFKNKKIRPDLCSRVVDAVELRDQHANNTYFKILLRRRSLVQVCRVLLFGIAVFVLLSIFGGLPKPFQEWKDVVVVILFGALGACLSVGHGLLATDISAKIPSQQIGSVVVWMRPAIGAAAALVALALVHANEKLEFFHWLPSDDFNVTLVIAFAAGFSERFIVGAIDKISQVTSKGD